MVENQKQAFAEMLKPKLKTYRMESDADVLREWWNCLCKFDIRAVEAALNLFMETGDDFILPAKIIKIIDAMTPDGRLGADEAWAMMPKDERSSAVISNEMAEAMGVARGLLEDGDHIAARMAFRDAYSRIVESNRARGLSPKWFPSLGHDPNGREEALKAAVEKGRISQDHMLALLPPPQEAQGAMSSAVRLITNNGVIVTLDDRQKHRERIEKLRGVLGGVNV